jgi:sec-independent protein translocase protein TatB
VFDFAWSEIALIGVVALIAIGPKDMPVAIKTVASMIKKARRMAGEFQTHVDEMVREANLDEVRSQINEIRNFDIKGEIERAVDEDGSLKQTLSGNPLDPVWTPPPAEAVVAEIAAPEPVVEEK